MGRIAKYGRRAFLIGSVAVAGGVAFGVWEYRRKLPNPLSAPEGGAVLTPYVVIDREGITIIAPRAEMGQGTQTMQAALVAEELEVPFESVRVIHGPPAQVYYNAALIAGHHGPEDEAPGPVGRMMLAASELMPKMLGMQVTGGSTATIDGFVKMRKAGATAREALKRAAAAQWGLDAADLKAESGAIIAPDGRSLRYEDLAEAAAGIELPDDVALKDPAQWRLLGKAIPRADMVAKCTGTATFGADIHAEGMRFATVRMNPRLGAGMRSFDAAEALSMPGVEKVLDLGDGIAVVASNTWLAIQAADAVQVDWEDADYPPETDAIMARIEAALDEKPNAVLDRQGDPDAAMSAPGATIVEAEYRVPYLAHATMEPMNATALFRPGERLDIWCGNQAPLLARDKAAKIAGLEKEQVHVHVPFLGGGFGRRAEPDAAILGARVAVQMPGIPVKVMWSREEDMRHDFYRPAAIARMRGTVADGSALALDAHVAAPSVTRQSMKRMTGFSPPGPDKAHLEAMADQPYAIRDRRVSGYLADVSIPVGFWRSVASSFNGFFHESFIDEMAHAAGRDPLEFRLDLVRKANAPSAAVLERVAEMSGWSGEKKPGRGRGVALSWSFSTPVAEVIEVAEQDGAIRILNAWIACDVGTALDPRNIRAQMQSGLIYGLSAAVGGEITFADGEVEQFNFPDYDALRMHNAPRIEVSVLENTPHIGGVGEPGTPPAAPALANALFDLTGRRARELPLSKSFDFLI